ncbi:MAG: methyltransferase domain-containing protein [Saccharolobus sp.]
MCDVYEIEPYIEHMYEEEIKGKRVLEVGSRYVNGSVRPLIEKFGKPREYIGIDIEPGKFVDVVIPAEKLIEHFGEESFDVVIANSVLEHVKDWRAVINNMKGVLKKGGYIYIHCPSIGFPYHAYPGDYWRYEVDDMKAIFRDFEILVLKFDPEPGVFLKARKPYNWNPVDLTNISLYSMILGKRTKEIVDINRMPLFRKMKLRITLFLISYLNVIELKLEVK